MSPHSLIWLSEQRRADKLELGSYLMGYAISGSIATAIVVVFVFVSEQKC